jgi:hypothetical protein
VTQCEVIELEHRLWKLVQNYERLIYHAGYVAGVREGSEVEYILVRDDGLADQVWTDVMALLQTVEVKP